MNKISLKLVGLFFVLCCSVINAQLITPTQNVCVGDTKKYTVDQADGPLGTPGSTYLWRVAETYFLGHIVNQGTNSIHINWGATPAGLYKLGVTETNSFCEGPEIILNITLKNIPKVTVNGAIICSGSSASIMASVSPPDSGNDYTYNWTTPSGVNPGNVPIVLASVAGDYSVTVKDRFGCVSAVAKGNVKVNPFVTAVITPAGSTSFCNGESVILTANKGPDLFYQWKKAGVDIQGATQSSYNATQSSAYTVKVTHSNGCFTNSLPIKVNVSVNPILKPVITSLAGESLEFCSGGSVVLKTNQEPGLSYQWKNSDNDVVGTSAAFTATQSSNYTVTATNLKGCSQTSLPVTVIVHSLPDASISAKGSIVFCDGDNLVLNAVVAPGLFYQWSNSNGVIPEANNSSYTATQSSDYTVTVTNGNFRTNCSATTNPPVTVINKSLPVTGTIAHD